MVQLQSSQVLTVKAILTALHAVGWALTASRIIRRTKSGRLGSDDCLVLAATCCDVGVVGTSWASCLPIHTDCTSSWLLVLFLLSSTACNWFQRLSTCCMLMRIFPFRHASGTGALAATVFMVLSCILCLPVTVMAYVHGLELAQIVCDTLNILGDALLIGLQLACFWRLHYRTHAVRLLVLISSVSHGLPMVGRLTAIGLIHEKISFASSSQYDLNIIVVNVECFLRLLVCNLMVVLSILYVKLTDYMKQYQLRQMQRSRSRSEDVMSTQNKSGTMPESVALELTNVITDDQVQLDQYLSSPSSFLPSVHAAGLVSSERPSGIYLDFDRDHSTAP